MNSQNTIALIAVLGFMGTMALGLWRFHLFATRVETAVNYLRLEHEMLMKDWAKRNGVALEEVPTRIKPAPWWGTSKGS